MKILDLPKLQVYKSAHFYNAVISVHGVWSLNTPTPIYHMKWDIENTFGDNVYDLV